MECSGAVAKKESSVMAAFSRLDNEVANLDAQAEKLINSIQSVLSSQEQPETATAEEPQQSDNCDVVANINQIARKVARIRDNITYIADRVQL